MLAQLASMRTKKDDEARAEAKFRMILLLQERFDTEFDRLRWYRYLAWLLALPKEYDRGVWTRVEGMKEAAMPFVTFAERNGSEKGEKKGLETGEKKGLAEGIKQAIQVAFEFRFPDAISSLMPQVALIGEVARLQRILQLAKTASLADIEAALA